MSVLCFNDNYFYNNTNNIIQQLVARKTTHCALKGKINEDEKDIFDTIVYSTGGKFCGLREG